MVLVSFDDLNPFLFDLHHLTFWFKTAIFWPKKLKRPLRQSKVTEKKNFAIP